jgi:antitoxin component of MazEF toxin-antitoxin module
MRTRSKYVYTIVVTMSTYYTTVIKTGNSYALRVPKKYVEDANLQLGQKVRLALPLSEKIQNRKKIQGILKQLEALDVYQEISNPATWQKQIRADRPLLGRE